VKLPELDAIMSSYFGSFESKLGGS